MNILITGAWQEAEKSINTIENMRHKVLFLQYEKDELPCDYEWVEGVICNGLFLHHSIEKFINLKYIQLTSAGYDRVPMEYVEQHNIRIYNARGVYSIPMAEFAIGGVLQLYKHMDRFAENQKDALWNKERNLLELFGRTVCIVGCGNVGTECAKRFKAFGCNVVGVDIVTREDENYSRIELIDNIDEVLVCSDIVVLTLPLTERTFHIMNKDRFEKMKKESVLVNIARGAVVDSTALIEALDNKKLGGAVLDVFEEEPLGNENRLWLMENVIVTPHNSFVGDGNRERLSKVIIDNLKI
ncbi:D-2-hydroxyacid dehydrogenase [Ruminococcus sp.]|uniref:D-2-hydroxyacid dehydrogenase n=1 Tax=Ruminococcus sp. TaxID=41978 RepID=UPI0025FCB8B7|nr:D-2-hydroxyacid dehydrogenase [Ruminococcus sp.]MCI6615537.1 D-2-hydroxyacid dehydrogenase [Ruminococcus sp.]